MSCVTNRGDRAQYCSCFPAPGLEPLDPFIERFGVRFQDVFGPAIYTEYQYGFETREEADAWALTWVMRWGTEDEHPVVTPGYLIFSYSSTSVRYKCTRCGNICMTQVGTCANGFSTWEMGEDCGDDPLSRSTKLEEST